MNLQDAFSSLYSKFGTHKKVAKALGITCEHYSAMRHGKVNIPQKTANLIILKALQQTENFDLWPPDSPASSASAPADATEPV